MTVLVDSSRSAKRIFGFRCTTRFYSSCEFLSPLRLRRLRDDRFELCHLQENLCRFDAGLYRRLRPYDRAHESTRRQTEPRSGSDPEPAIVLARTRARRQTASTSSARGRCMARPSPDSGPRSRVTTLHPSDTFRGKQYRAFKCLIRTT